MAYLTYKKLTLSTDPKEEKQCVENMTGRKKNSRVRRNNFMNYLSTEEARIRAIERMVSRIMEMTICS